MWYIVKTELYKEREAIRELLRLSGIEDIYFPKIRQSMPTADNSLEGAVGFRPVISGVLFVYAKSAEILSSHLDVRGYFLRAEKPEDVERPVGSQRNSERVVGEPHLFPLDTVRKSLESMLRQASISDEEMYRYKVCVEQCAAHTDDIQIVGKNYADLVAENDLLMITDGPFRGFTGVIKQVKSHGVKDRCFFFSLGSCCVRLPSIRRYGVIVVRESANGTKAQLPNTWRYIDFLIGKLQATYFADTASAALRRILEYYNRVESIEECQNLLLRAARLQPTEQQSREVALLAVWLQQIDDEELGALKSLRRFFQSQDNSVADVLPELIPDMPLRPFLTPSPGVELLKGKNYILFPHRDFTELIFRVSLKDVFLKAENYPSLNITDKQEGRYTGDGKLKGRMRKARPFHLSDREYVYYVHVALFDREDGMGVTAMVNWGGFLHRYLQLTAEEHTAFLHDLQAKDFKETLCLLTQGEMLDMGAAMSGFTCHIPNIDLSTLMARYDRALKLRKITPPLSLLRPFVPVAQLVRRCIPSAVEFWQRQRLLEWRHLIQHYVLLHNLPLCKQS